VSLDWLAKGTTRQRTALLQDAERFFHPDFRSLSHAIGLPRRTLVMPESCLRVAGKGLASRRFPGIEELIRQRR
jgi:hypothetical protein